MKKYISVILIVTLALTVLLTGLAGPARADGVVLTVTPEPAELLKGGNVNFRITIVNNNAEALADFTVREKSTGASVTGGAVPGGGGVIETVLTLSVSDTMLNQTLIFELYSGGNELTKATTKVNKKIPVVKMGITASASTDLADAGDVVTFTFKVENQGEANLDNIVIKAANLNGGKALKDSFSLAAGSSPFTFTYKHTMTGDITVTPTVSYSAGGVAQTPATLNPISITLGKRNVEVRLTADNNNPHPGEDVTLTLTVTNGGNVSYSDLQVSMNSESVDFPTSRLKPGETFTQTYKRSFLTATDVTFSLTMKDHNNETRSVSSNTVKISLPVDMSVVGERLKLVLNVDRPQLTGAGTVNFSGYISNATEYELLDVAVNEAGAGNIYRSASLAAGGTASIEWPVDINETTTYRFVLTATDKDGNNYSIPMEPVTVTVQSIEPTPTNFDDAADVTESGQVLDGGAPFDWSKFFLIMAIVLIVLIIGIGVALIVLWKKGKTPGGSKTGKKAAPRTAASSQGARKKPASYGRGPRKPTGSKGYRDRNNF